MRDGSRRVVNITEIGGMEGDIITMTDIFVFEQTGIENTTRRGYSVEIWDEGSGCRI